MERVLAKTRKKGGERGGGWREREGEKKRELFLKWRNCVDLRRGNERLDDREEKFGKTKLRKKKKNEKIGRKKKELLRETQSDTEKIWE